MPKINEIDQRVLGALTGRDRLKTLLREQGLSIKDFAIKHGEWTEAVSRCMAGDSPHPEIREKLATEVGLTRKEIDRLIDGVPVA